MQRQRERETLHLLAYLPKNMKARAVPDQSQRPGASFRFPTGVAGAIFYSFSAVSSRNWTGSEIVTNLCPYEMLILQGVV